MEITQFSSFPVDLKDDWNRLLVRGVCNAPFLTFEYLQDWWQTRGGGEWPAESELAILVAREGDELVGIAPLFIARHEGKRKLLLLGSIEISDFLDLIVAPKNEKRFAAALLEFFSTRLAPMGVEGLELFNVLEDSPTLPAMAEAARAAGYTVEQTCLQQAPCITLPGDWDAYLESIDKKQRHEIRRKMRRAVEGEVKVELYFTSDPLKVDEDTEAFLSLMAQDPEKAEFLKPEMRSQFKLSIRRAFDLRNLQLAFLKVGGSNAAAYLNFDYDNRIWVYNSGIDRKFTEYSPGWVLLGHLLQWANEHQRSHFDFMRGNEDYKYKFGAVDRVVCRLSITK
jgi:CelD/BcsL family acetyltransferase involved in cellulose biosynthesis